MNQPSKGTHQPDGARVGRYGLGPWLFPLALMIAGTGCRDQGGPTVALVDGDPVREGDFVPTFLREQGPGYFQQIFLPRFLVEREAQRAGVVVPREEVAREVLREERRVVTDTFQGSQEIMRRALERQGLSLEGYRRALVARVRHRLLAVRLYQASMAHDEEHLRESFEERYGPGGVRKAIRQIVITFDPMRSRFYTRADYDREGGEGIERFLQDEAAKILTRLEAGERFEDLAARLSDDPGPRRDGDLGVHWKGRFCSRFDQAVARTEVGRLGPVVSCPDGLMVFHVYGMYRAWELRVSRILFSLFHKGAGGEDEDLAARERAAAALARLEAGEAFEDVAKRLSEDPVTRRKGGDMGRFTTGTLLDPKAEAAVLALQPGRRTGIVRVREGYAIMRLDAKKRLPERDSKQVRAIFLGRDFSSVKRRKLRGRIRRLAADRATEIMARIAKGEVLQDLVRAYSDDSTSRAKGGLVPADGFMRLPEEVRAAVQNMKPGAPPTKVTTSTGIRIVEVVEEERTRFEAVRKALVREIEAREPAPKEVERFVRELVESAKVERLAPWFLRREK